jgi:hypothetical protein
MLRGGAKHAARADRVDYLAGRIMGRRRRRLGHGPDAGAERCPGRCQALAQWLA